jgi:DNA-binding NarL/FixJ family response regulator
MRIVLAEDGTLLREGLAGLLETFSHQVVASVGDANALVEATERLNPDLVVTDVRMPPTGTDDGLKATARIRASRPGLGVVVLTQYAAPAYVSELLVPGSHGGFGYVLKDRIGDVAEFLDIIRRVADGDTVIDPEVVRQVIDRQRNPHRALTERERQVLTLLAQGRSNAAIARHLVVTEAAVGKHIANIYGKLDFFPDQDYNRRVLAVLRYLGT